MASALDALKALANKKVTSTAPALSAEMNDPAIVGAKRAGSSKNVVNLGFDPSVTEHAARTAALKSALERAKAEYEIEQAVLRDYGKQKRGLYNDLFKTNITTVCVPYTSEVPNDENSDTPGRETQYVQVVCTNRYSIERDTVLSLEEKIGPEVFEKLFVKDTTKILKPNAEVLIRNLLEEMGLKGEMLENSMTSLFDTETTVKTAEAYEQEIKKAPEPVQVLLSQSVTRVQPSVKV